MRPFRLKVTEYGGRPRDFSERNAMKPLNVFPMVIMLVAIILLIVWLRPH